MARRFDPCRLETERLEIRDVVRELVAILGSRRVVALLAGVSSVREVSAWMDEQEPQSPPAERAAILRSALQAARLIEDVESRDVASAWFVGTNPNFDFDSPARILRDRGAQGRTLVLRAAKAYVADALAHAETAVPKLANGDVKAGAERRD